MKNHFYYILLLKVVSLAIASNNIFPTLSSIESNNRSNSVHIVAIMVEFDEDEDTRTTGNGKFLLEDSENYIQYY